MAHKQHWHSSTHSRRHHSDGHHGNGKEKKKAPQRQGQAVAHTREEAGESNVGTTWTMDPSRQFVYRTIETSNGDIRYDIAGPEAYNDPPADVWVQSQYLMPYPDVNYPTSKSNGLCMPEDLDGNYTPTEVVGHTASGRIRVETFPSNDINIVTPSVPVESASRDVVLVLQAGSDIEITSAKGRSRSSSHRSIAKRQERWKSHDASEMHVSRVLVDRGAQSRLKVSDWLTRNASR
ncbi:hypothetical protein BJ170DRAFT_74893 [Xylariales sp. AK1849]|nr:hypothetical protein BJ170DRAFT_74893 [Xylariales sp. AK1849]